MCVCVCVCVCGGNSLICSALSDHHCVLTVKSSINTTSPESHKHQHPPTHLVAHPSITPLLHCRQTHFLLDRVPHHIHSHTIALVKTRRDLIHLTAILYRLHLPMTAPIVVSSFSFASMQVCCIVVPPLQHMSTHTHVATGLTRHLPHKTVAAMTIITNTYVPTLCNTLDRCMGMAGMWLF